MRKYPKTYKCICCGKDVKNIHFNPDPEFCSKKCKGIIMTKNSTIELVCSYCKKRFIKLKSEFSKGNGTNGKHYCSKKCFQLSCVGKISPLKGRYGKEIAKDGYLYMGRIRKCRFIMEQAIGRKLTSRETVHHRNGIKDDDRIENLELWISSHPAGQRVSEKIAWAIEFLKTYKYEIIPPFNDAEICKVIAQSHELTPICPTRQIPNRENQPSPLPANKER